MPPASTSIARPPEGQTSVASPCPTSRTTMRDQPTGGPATATALVAGGAQRINAAHKTMTAADSRRIHGRRVPIAAAHATYHAAISRKDGAGTSTTSHGARSTSDAERISALV